MNYESIYRQLSLARAVEEKIIELYPSDKIRSPVHLGCGQEAVSVAVCEALQLSDVAYGSYRSHNLYIAKTQGDQTALNELFAELYGKIGCCRGKGGSMHLSAPKFGLVTTSAIVAGTIPLAVGHAFANKLLNKPNISVVFFGDGALEEGSFLESLNFAMLHHLGVILICENNSVAVNTPQSDRQYKNICEVVRDWGGCSYQKLNSVDIEDLYDSAYHEINYLRSKLGTPDVQPVFLEVETCRYMEHVGIGTDEHLQVRDFKEIEAWKQQDPLITLKSHFTDGQLESIRLDVVAQIKEAVQFAEQAPWPGPEELLQHV